jgi:hypothetical protein
MISATGKMVDDAYYTLSGAIKRVEEGLFVGAIKLLDGGE